MLILAHIFATVGLVLGLLAVLALLWAVRSFEVTGREIHEDEEADLL